MAYVFDGYSEANSARNSPGRQGQPQTGSRQRRRERDEPMGGSGVGSGSEGVYFGTGRFYEENLRNEQQQRQREREHQQMPRSWSTGPFGGGGLNGSVFSAGGDAWSEEEWERVLMEALRRARERRWQERSGGGGGDGAGVFGTRGGPGPQDFGDDEETRFDDLFDDLFGAARGGGRGDDGGEGRGAFGAGAGGHRGFGFFGGGGGGRTDFEGVFGSPGDLPSREQCCTGTATGLGFGDREDVRRGGAGMTWAEFTELFRHRYDGGSSYGYADGRPPADLFDSWHTDW